MEFFNSFVTAVESGLMYAVLALGFYISYSILDFPDLSVEGTFLTGGVVFAVCVTHGVSPWIAMLFSAVSGALAGAVTGILHVKLKIRDLLCGILVSTALITVNLITASVSNGGSFAGDGMTSVIISRRTPTVLRMFPFSEINDLEIRKLAAFFVIVIVIKLIIDLYLKTKSGMLLRATGDNSQFTAMLARDSGNVKILGLSMGNALAALSGAICAQSKGSADQSMGIGIVIIGLASVIIGMSVFKKVRFMKNTTKVILGAVIYQLCFAIALILKVPSAYNKLIMAGLFAAALIAGNKSPKGRVSK